MGHRRIFSRSENQVAGKDDPRDKGALFPRNIAELLGIPPESSVGSGWDAFLKEYGGVLLKTAKYAHRRFGSSTDSHDASMDAYAFILEKLRQDEFRRLRAFSGEDLAALSRWLVVVARRLCTDFWRRRYGRGRPNTPELTRDIRRRLVDEIWDPRESSDLPAKRESNPEWKLRYEERRRALESAMADMEPKDRLLVAFRFEDCLSARRISELMDFPTPFHVYRRLNHVLAALRERLESMGIEGPSP